ncbi:retrovirus-related pol polyprotein from transposon TNT 1-94 [Tanacetum coccineum]
MARQCTQPKRPRNSAWFKEKILLVQAQEVGQVLDEEQLAFLADPGIPDGQAIQITIPQNAAFQTDDIDAYDSTLSNLNSEQLDVPHTPVKIEAPKELPKVNLCFVDKKHFENQKKELFLDNDRLLEQIISQHIVLTIVNSCDVIGNSENIDRSFVEKYNEYLELEAELAKKKDMIEHDLQAKDTTISNLKKQNHSLNDICNQATVKKDIDEYETINIKLEHSVAKLLRENKHLHKEREHLKKTYKELYDSIKKTRVQTKDHIKNAAPMPQAIVIASRMFKLDLEPLAPKVLKSRDAHINYIKHSREHVDTLREIDENARALSPLDSNLDSACKYVQRIQEVLVYVTDTCPSLTKPSEKLVAVTPLNRNKKVRMKSSTSASRSQPSGNTKNNRISRTTSNNIQNKVEDQPRSVKSSSNKENRVIEQICNASVKHQRWTFTIDGNTCPLTRITSTKVVPLKETTSKSVITQNPEVKVVQIVLWYLDSGCSKHTTGNRSQLINFIHKFLGNVRFGNDQIAKIIGYRDYQMGNVMIYQVYYVEGLGHNLFSVRQFFYFDLEVAFRKHTCYIRDLEGVALLKGSRGSNLYTFSLEDMMLSSPIYLLSKASKTKSWLWHRRLSHLNFDYITTLAKQGLVRGLPILKFQKDHLCSICALGESKKHSHKPKPKDSIQEKLYVLHVDLCGPMRIQSINGRKYILVIVDDYSRFTWVNFLRSKDEVPEFVINFLKLIQVRLNATVRNIRTDNRTDQDLGKLKPKADFGIFIGYALVKKAFRIYKKRTCLITETIYVDFDELIAIASKQFSSGPGPQLLTRRTLNSGLMSNPPSPTPYVPPTMIDWDILFQLVFDEYFNHPPSIASTVPAVVAPEPVDSTGLPSSTTIDQDAPCSSTS